MNRQADCAHEFGPEKAYVSKGGPLDGTWLVSGCVYCNAFTLWPASGGDGMHLLEAKLRELGCEP